MAAGGQVNNDDGAIAAARSGIVTIFAAGNDYNLNNPDAIAGLGYFVPDIAPNWITVAALQRNPDQASANPYIMSTFSSRCGYTASFCVAAPGTQIYSSIISGTNARTPGRPVASKAAAINPMKRPNSVTSWAEIPRSASI
mgnify:CR=1 FL=1